MKNILIIVAILYSSSLVAQTSSSDFKYISIYNEKANIVDELDKDIPKGKTNLNGIAVVIGNKDYKNASKVNFAIQDAVIMKKYLEIMMGFKPENIIYIQNATYLDFRSVFGDAGNNKGRLYNLIDPGKSQVYIYYSGHGAPDPNDQQAYLVPTDADPNHLSLTGFKLETLYSNVSSMPVEKAVFVIDACFSGSTSNGEQIINYASPVGIKVKKAQLLNYDQKAIISAASSNQIASWYPQKRHGLLTYKFLEGLKGDADFNDDNVIDIKEMRTWLTDKANGVQTLARKIFSREQDPEVEGNDDFVLRRIK